MKKVKRRISLILSILIMFTIVPVKAIKAAETSKNTTVETGISTPVKPESKIIGEVVEKRDKYTKTFQREDMTFDVAIFPIPVNYNEDGVWKEIDNSLSDEKDENNNDVLSNKANDIKVKFAKNSKSDKLVRLSKDKYEVAWALEGALETQASVTPEDSESYNLLSENDKKKVAKGAAAAMEYKDILPSGDLQYKILGDKVKENIVLKDRTYTSQFSFTLAVKNLIPKLGKDNKVVFYDEKDSSKAVYSIEAPVMYDANNAMSSDIKLALSEGKNEKEYILTIIPDSSWLNSGERTYPIFVDPNITSSQTPSAVFDTFICSTDTADKWNNTFLRVGQTTGVGITRSLIKFKLPNNLTSADMIIGANLNLVNIGSETRNGGALVNLHKVTSDWGTYDANHNPVSAQGVFWSNKPSYDENNVEDMTLIGSSTENTRKWWDITSIVKDWVTTGSNYGMLLKANNESSGNVAFAASDLGSTYYDYIPVASIQYINNSGLEGYWNFHSQSAGRAGTGYVNDYNGNMVFVHNDLTMNGNRMPINLNHVYNSNITDDIGFGPGWRLNLSENVRWRTIQDKSYLQFIDSDGTSHYFEDDASKTELKDELNLGLTCTKNPYSTYTIKDDKSGTKLDFDMSGDLVDIKDANGNTLNCEYKNLAPDNSKKLVAVTDGALRKTILNYDSTGHLSDIVDPSSRSTLYRYDYYSRLNFIVYPDGNSSSYRYYDYPSKLLVKAFDTFSNVDDYTITYDYYTAYINRVKKISESSKGTLGGELNITYGNNTTKFTDVSGRTSIYQFDNVGKVISVRDPDGSAKYYKFGDSDNETKLTTESKLEKTVINLLYNHNFETSDNWQFGKDGGTGTSGFTTEASYFGKQGIKINKTDSISRQYASQTLTVWTGTTYTLSGYVRTDNVSKSNGGGATISAYYKDKNGALQSVESKAVNGTTGWQRLDISFTIPSDAYDGSLTVKANLANETGTVYFDSMQLEERGTLNRYNLVDNGDMKGFGTTPDRWVSNTSDSSDTTTVNTDADRPTDLTSRVYKVGGVSQIEKTLKQLINVSGKANDVFTIGGWAKGHSVICGTFAMKVAITGPSGTQWESFDFNKDSNDWQYISDKFITKNDYSYIEVYFVYGDNANTAYFDGAQLYKEEFGQSYQYDSKGNIISSADLDKQNSKFEYGTNNDLTGATDAKGNKFSYTYDDKHNVNTGTSSENVVYSFEYDKYGNPTTSKVSKVNDDSQFMKSTAAYTDNGNYMTSLTDSSGHKVGYDYDQKKGTLGTTTDADNKITSYTYDPQLDRMTDVSKTVTDNNNNQKTVKNSYNYKNDKLDTISSNYVSYNFGYDSLGNNTTVSVGGQNLITNNYESRTGKLLSSLYGNGQKVSSDYDSYDRVIAKRYNDNIRFTYQYNANGDLGFKQDLLRNLNYKYLYDLSGRLAGVSETSTIDSKERKTDFEFDANNNTSKVLEQIDPYSFTDLSTGKVAQASSLETTSVPASYAFDGSSTTRWASGHTDQQWIYVNLGEIKSINRVVLNWESAYADQYEIQVSNDGTTWTTVYSTKSGDGGVDDIKGLCATGKYVKMNGIHRATAYGYSLWDFKVYSDNTIATRYDYDKDNRPSTLTYTRNSLSTLLSYTYDNIARLSYTTLKMGDTTYKVGYTYNEGVVDPTTDNTSPTYGKKMTTTKIATMTNGSSSPISYTYDVKGNIKTITQGGKTINYKYNELNELIREDNQVLGHTYTYEYDEDGNIQSKTEYNYTAPTSTPTILSKTYSYTYGDLKWKDKLTNFDGKEILYDNTIGNPQSYNGWNYSWEEGRQLSGISGNGYSISYKYNDSGIRTQKTVNGVTTNYHLVGDKVTYEENGTDKIYYTYDSSDNLVSMNLNGVEYYYIRNAQGDIIGLIDKTGTQVVSYIYDSWGKLLPQQTDSNGNVLPTSGITGSMASTVGVKNPYRYRGYRYDAETGLYYLQSRYYNPEWGRFINADGLVGQTGELLSANMFAYCGNNPINSEDSNGYFSFNSLVKNVVSTVKNVTTSVLSKVADAAPTALALVSDVFTIMTGIAMCTNPIGWAIGGVMIGHAFLNGLGYIDSKYNYEQKAFEALLGKEKGDYVYGAVDFAINSMSIYSSAVDIANGGLQASKIANGYHLNKALVNGVCYTKAVYNSSLSFPKLGMQLVSNGLSVYSLLGDSSSISSNYYFRGGIQSDSYEYNW